MNKLQKAQQDVAKRLCNLHTAYIEEVVNNENVSTGGDFLTVAFVPVIAFLLESLYKCNEAIEVTWEQPTDFIITAKEFCNNLLENSKKYSVYMKSKKDIH